MAPLSWQLRGEYFESCNCDYLWPCLYTNASGQPTTGYCDVAMVFHIDQGPYGSGGLDDLTFVIVAHVPGTMGDGNWSVGLIIDERATPE